MDFMNPLWGRISRALSASEDMEDPRAVCPLLCTQVMLRVGTLTTPWMDRIS